jgi:hypothetical protein
MSKHARRSATSGATDGFLRTGARPGVLGLLLAGLLLAAACDHKTAAAQTLRACVDRWNQGNMVGSTPCDWTCHARRGRARPRSTGG